MLISGLLACGSTAFASAPAASQPTLSIPPPPGSSETPVSTSSYEKIRERLGVTYFSYFYGPGIHPNKSLYNPNQLGLPQNDGMYFQNQVSFRFKFNSNLALDFQTRFNVILNNFS